MDFDKQLEDAIQRGQQNRDARGREKSEKALTEDELRTLHSKYRLDLSEHIESCLHKLADRFPGFDFKTVVGEEGWGARITRDDFGKGRDNLYSRYEMLITPFNSAQIVELTIKGTIRNKEVLSRNHYKFLNEFDVPAFIDQINMWVLEYAEKFAAR